jgi:maltose alpha-D-glucosyltransferase/alpha-amylase
LLLVHNLAGSAQAVELEIRQFKGAVPIELFGESRFPAVGEAPYMLSLAPYGYYWFQLQRTTGGEPTYGIEDSLI